MLEELDHTSYPCELQACLESLLELAHDIVSGEMYVVVSKICLLSFLITLIGKLQYLTLSWMDGSRLPYHARIVYTF